MGNSYHPQILREKGREQLTETWKERACREALLEMSGASTEPE